MLVRLFDRQSFHNRIRCTVSLRQLRRSEDLRHLRICRNFFGCLRDFFCIGLFLCLCLFRFQGFLPVFLFRQFCRVFRLSRFCFLRGIFCQDIFQIVFSHTVSAPPSLSFLRLQGRSSGCGP